MTNTFGFIGCGNLAKAILSGMLRSGHVKFNQIWVYDIDSEKAESLAALGAQKAGSLEELANNAKFLFLTVKPQIYPVVLNELSASFEDDKVLISVAPGITTSRIRQLAGRPNAKVVRTMPNTPLLLSAGATAIAKASRVPEADFQVVANVFEASGSIRFIDEAQMDAVIAVNGSSPAYFFLLADLICSYAAAQGIGSDAALTLFADTMAGSAHMLKHSGKTPAELIAMVESPNGTTEAALKAMRSSGLPEAFLAGLGACLNRAAELSQ